MTLEEFRNRRYIIHALHGLQLETILEAQRWGDSCSAWATITFVKMAASYGERAAHFVRMAFPELKEEV